MTKKMICFGDSLVFGYKVLPSSNWVTLLGLEHSLKTINRGQCGDTTLSMLTRFEQHVLCSDADTILIMAGSNDFLQRIRTADTVNHLLYMLRRAEGEGKRVFLSTITPYSPDGFEQPFRTREALLQAEPLRQSLNARLRLLPECIDTAAPFESLPENELQSCLIDGIHLSPKGHRIAADYIGNFI